MTMRRILLALAVSLAAHVGVLAVAVAFGLWQGRSLVPALQLRPISVDVVKNLPLGAPPDPQNTAQRPPPLTPPRTRHHVSKSRDSVTVPAPPDAGTVPSKPDAAVHLASAANDGGVDGGRRKPGDLRSHGPDDARLLALLRLDRLRTLPDKDALVGAVDQLLKLLPDRHRLMDDTGLDLYRDFDSLLIATPNPADDAVTFLAARHHLSDGAFRTALDRGAKAAHSAIEWHLVDGRPVGIRRHGKNPASASGVWERDNRILVLPQPSLAVMATPAYAARLLGANAVGHSNSRTSVDAAAADGESTQPVAHVDWQELAKDIDAEDSAIPDDATFMMTATHLLIAGQDAAGVVVPPTRGTTDDSVPQPVGNRSPMPEVITLVVGTETPYIELIADFKATSEADQWERDLPAWKRRIATNPLVLLSGFSGLVSRAEASRDGNTLQLRAETSAEELQRLLNLVANLARTALAQPR